MREQPPDGAETRYTREKICDGRRNCAGAKRIAPRAGKCGKAALRELRRRD